MVKLVHSLAVCLYRGTTQAQHCMEQQVFHSQCTRCQVHLISDHGQWLPRNVALQALLQSTKRLRRVGLKGIIQCLAYLGHLCCSSATTPMTLPKYFQTASLQRLRISPGFAVTQGSWAALASYPNFLRMTCKGLLQAQRAPLHPTQRQEVRPMPLLRKGCSLTFHSWYKLAFWYKAMVCQTILCTHHKCTLHGLSIPSNQCH